MNSSARILGITANATRSVSAACTESSETGDELTVEADVRRRAHLDVDVGCATVDGLPQHLVEIEHRDVLPRVGSAGVCRPTAVSAAREGG